MEAEAAEGEPFIDNPAYVAAVEGEGEPTIPNPDYVAPEGVPTIDNPDYVEGTPDLPEMIEDKGFDDNKKYLKWVMEKACESYARQKEAEVG